VKYFFLLLAKFTYIPVPKKLQANAEDLPRAMRCLPLLGLFCGTLIYLSSRLLVVMPATGAAAAMLGLNVLLGGAFLLRDLITIADGLSIDPIYPPNMAPAAPTQTNPANAQELAAKHRRFNAGRAGLVWGMIWLLGLYSLYLWYFRSNIISNIAFIAAPVISRWLMSWTIFYFYATPPAWLHRNFGRRDFLIATAFAFVSVIFFSRPALYMSILVSFLGIYLFATYRQRYVGALDDSCYGAVCAWAEVLFLLGWMTFDRFL
jgi:cobalamin synthase